MERAAVAAEKKRGEAVAKNRRRRKQKSPKGKEQTRRQWRRKRREDKRRWQQRWWPRRWLILFSLEKTKFFIILTSGIPYKRNDLDCKNAIRNSSQNLGESWRKKSWRSDSRNRWRIMMIMYHQQKSFPPAHKAHGLILWNFRKSDEKQAEKKPCVQSNSRKFVVTSSVDEMIFWEISSLQWSNSQFDDVDFVQTERCSLMNHANFSLNCSSTLLIRCHYCHLRFWSLFSIVPVLRDYSYLRASSAGSRGTKRENVRSKSVAIAFVKITPRQILSMNMSVSVINVGRKDIWKVSVRS